MMLAGVEQKFSDARLGMTHGVGDKIDGCSDSVRWSQTVPQNDEAFFLSM